MSDQAPFATLADLAASGLVSTAFGALTSDQRSQALADATDELASYFRARYAMPLSAWDASVIKATLKVAAWNLLTLRGFNPSAGADITIRQGYEDAIEWAKSVQRGAAHPQVTEARQDVKFERPRVISSSVVAVGSGCTAPNRGW